MFVALLVLLLWLRIQCAVLVAGCDYGWVCDCLMFTYLLLGCFVVYLL